MVGNRWAHNNQMEKNLKEKEKLAEYFLRGLALAVLIISPLIIFPARIFAYQIEKINQDTISLERPVGDDGDEKSTLGDFIKDDKISSPDQDTSRRILADQIREIINDLSPKEKKILEMRNGLNDGIYHTLEEVGKEFGVTRERIRQIEAKALEKIQKHDKAQRLRNY